jgi:DMSO/TMAO reductase YedYZ molybdopterin-dependent catalytic subunit
VVCAVGHAQPDFARWQNSSTCEDEGRRRGQVLHEVREGAGQPEMTQPDTGARESSEREQNSPAAWETGPIAAGLAGGGLAGAGLCDATQPESGPGGSLPPGQYVPRTLPVLHYGPVPTFNPDSWDLRIFGATASGAEARLSWGDVRALPASEVTADFHCVTKFTVPGLCWSGVLAMDLLHKFPPAPAVTHAMIWADFGYSANIRITDFAADDTVLATHRNGEPLGPEHGFPLRLVVPSLYAWKSVKWVRAIEYLTVDRRGFWEERGYHNVADPWREQRYSYQELDGEGPPL